MDEYLEVDGDFKRDIVGLISEVDSSESTASIDVHRGDFLQMRAI